MLNNAFLVVVTVVLSLVIIAGSIYVLVYFQHPEDRLTAWVPKIVVVLSLTLVCFSVLMLPLDKANSSNINSPGGFPMDVLWLIVFITMAVLAIVVIPFSAFYYEADEYDEEAGAGSQIVAAVKGTLIVFVVFAVISVIMFIFLGIAEVPTKYLGGSFQTTEFRQVPVVVYDNISTDGNTTYNLVPRNETAFKCVNNTFQNITRQNIALYFPGENSSVFLENGTFIADFPYPIINISNSTRGYYLDVYNTTNTTCFYANTGLLVDLNATPVRDNIFVLFRVSFALWIVSIIIFFGWFLFMIFGGVGLVALPLDCIASWKKRPIPISIEKYTAIKREIGVMATKLMEKGKVIQDRQKRGKERKRDRRNYNKFRQAVFMLDEDYERLQECYKRQGGKLIIHFLVFIFGILSAGLTILWLLHILLFMFTQPNPFHPFLNSMLTGLDRAWGLLGVIAYGIFSFYLLLCCIKGNFKFGMRVFLFPIHPMRVGNTLMHAFLFNVALIVICSFAVVQFCSVAFAEYAAASKINSMFALAVANLKGLKWILYGYIYGLFIMAFLTAIFFVFKPRDKPAIDQID